MAEKDKDEEKFDDDEDFGLPELHYEELDDDDPTEKEEEVASTTEEKPEEPAADPFGEQTTSETDQSFYEEESFDEFKDDSNTSTGSVFDSDDSPEPDAFVSSDETSTFGEDTYTQPETTESYSSYYDEESSKKAKSNFTKIVIIGTLLFASIAIVFIFFIKPGELLSSTEEEVLPPPSEPVEEEVVVDSAATVFAEPESVEPEPTQLPAGEIATLEERTGKSYVVIGSFFDGDLAMDYAKILAQNGNSPQIIPPFNNYRFFRVAIAEFGTFQEAEAQAPSYGEQFGREAWPLKY